MSQGILVGADATQEWLLPWWWKYYTRHNCLPVTFVDFGMTTQSLEWCQKRGQTIRLNFPQSFIANKEDVDPNDVKLWERWSGEDVWSWRKVCFNKPFALPLTPYEETIWIDLDCEIFTSITPLFSYLQNADLVIADPDNTNRYNSGVMVYRKNSAFLKPWADLCIEQNAKFYSDDFALTYLLKEMHYPFQLLPREWNWQTKLGINLFVKIFHWSSELGKSFIKHHDGIQDFIP